jgi:hypothetical protein
MKLQASKIQISNFEIEALINFESLMSEGKMTPFVRHLCKVNLGYYRTVLAVAKLVVRWPSVFRGKGVEGRSR